MSDAESLERGLGWGAALSRAVHVPLTMLYLLDPGSSRENVERASAIAEGRLAVAATDERLADLEVGIEVQVGLPHETLPAEAGRSPGSVPILVASAQGLARRALLGTDSHAVIHSLRSPFIVLPHQSTSPIPIERAVVGFDGSELSLQVQRSVAELAPAFAVSVTTVEAIEPSQRSGPEFLTFKPEISERRVVVRGRAGQTLLAVARARRAGLIIVGSHGRGQMTRLLLGGTTECPADHADRPVVVIPETLAAGPTS